MIIAVITALAGLLWALTALTRSGFEFDSLNPFLAVRRWRWSREYGAKPLYKLERPMDAAAVLLVATCKADGVMSAEQKQALLSMFEQRFELSETEASQLLAATIHLLRNELSIADSVDKILERSSARFEDEQVKELAAMMRRIAAMDGSINAEQEKLISTAEAYFQRLHAPQQKWR